MFLIAAAREIAGLAGRTVLGHGACGSVYKLDDHRAVKVINAASMACNANAAAREIDALGRLYVIHIIIIL